MRIQTGSFFKNIMIYTGSRRNAESQQTIKECIDIRMKDLCQSDQFRHFDVHAVCFQFGISAFGYDNTHEIQFCNDLVLCQIVFIAESLDVITDIHVWSDFLHNTFSLKR